MENPQTLHARTNLFSHIYPLKPQKTVLKIICQNDILRTDKRKLNPVINVTQHQSVSPNLRPQIYSKITQTYHCSWDYLAFKTSVIRVTTSVKAHRFVQNDVPRLHIATKLQLLWNKIKYNASHGRTVYLKNYKQTLIMIEIYEHLIWRIL